MRPHALLATISLVAAPIVTATAIPQAEGSECINPVVRKEWRQLTTTEKDDYIQAAVCLRRLPKKKYADIDAVVTRLDDLVYTHQRLTRKIHFVADFLPWHRWYVQVHEDLLRTECGYSGYQPYWDWTIEGDSKSMVNSPLFDPVHGFGGDGKNTNSTVPGFERCVTDGPFANTNLTLGMGSPDINVPGDRLHCFTRQFNGGDLFDENGNMIPGDMQATAYNSTVMQTINNFDKFSDMVNMLEGLPHAQIHSIILGDLGPASSPNEPLFFLHHGMVDRAWAKWQGNNATRLVDYAGFMDVDRTIPASINNTMPVLELGDTLPIVKDYMNIQAGPLCYTYTGL
ncbi:tyrosinase central domain-containing protein [Colletotrichum incanum]|nr:tyrosinase central domain-containing protein [Colletotrichum incanum]